VITTFVAFVAVAVRVEELPGEIELGFALKTIVAGVVVTVTVVVDVTVEPLLPVAVAV